MTLSERSRVSVGLGAMLLLTALTALTFSNTIRNVLAGGGQEVRAEFETTRQLAKGSQVRISGVRVGEVKKIDLDDDGRGATVTMEVSEKALPLYRDAKAAIRFRSLLGGSEIVQLLPGSPSAGQLGDRVIGRDRTRTQVELDDLTQDSLQADPRAGLQQTLDEVPRALAGRDETADVLGTLAGAGNELEGGLRAARGIEDGDLTRLVTSASGAVRAMDAPTQPLERFVAGGAQTVAATAAREGDLRATVRATAAALPVARRTLARLETTLGGVDPLVARLDRSASDVAPAVRDLRGTLERADVLLREAPPLLRALRPAVMRLASASRTAKPLLDALEPSIDRVNKSILPNLAEPDPVTKRPTYQMLGPGIASVMSVAGQYDSEGYFARLAAGGGERALDSLPCRGTALDPERPEALNCAALTTTIQNIFQPPKRRAAKRKKNR